MKKKILIFGLLIILIFSLASCSDDEIDYSDTTKISFKSAASYDYLKTLDGKTIEINGYMATSSPVDGSFMFLMNLPYQSCPFCVPNTTQLSNTIEVYPAKNSKFSYTTSAIKVYGKLVVNMDPENPFTDPYGYQFNFKLVDAEYKILKDEDITGNLALWQQVANSGLVNDLFSMFDYLNFVCCWPEYFVNTKTDAYGNVTPGYYLYASDALHYITTDGAQWNYGYKDGYFDNLISDVKKISATGFNDLVQIIQDAENLANYALSELELGHYTYVQQYVKKFGTTDYIYTMNDTTLKSKNERLYYKFSDWIGSFEL